MLNTACRRAIVLVSLTTGLANAASQGLLLGTAAPSTIVGGIYLLTPFPADPRPEFDPVSDVPSPLGGNVGLDTDLDHLVVPFSWGSWSHGYVGDVYAFPAGAVGSPDFTLTFTLPADTAAFVFYAEPADFGIFDFSAVAAGGPLLSSPVDGDGGAVGFAFYADPGETLGPITITSSASFAVGEFSIAAVPEASTSLGSLLGAAVLGGTVLRRRNRA